MRRVIDVVSVEEFDEWMASQKSYYFSNVRGTDKDPNKGKMLNSEIRMRSKNFRGAVKAARNAEDEAAKIIRLQYVNFVTGGSTLTPNSKYELKDLANALNEYPTMTIEVAGHTDNVGSVEGNNALSNARAQSVFQFLVDQGIPASRMTAVGYGSSVELESNDTEAGRAANRRTEFKIISK